jgi:N-methylhydantoinase B
VQDYVERLTRRRIAALGDCVLETEDYLDLDPAGGEGLIPIRVRLEIRGDQLHYDLSGSHGAVGSFLNSGFGATCSAVYAGTKTFFPDVPLNSGFYRAVTVDLGPEGTVVNAPWPHAVTGFCSGPYEKIMNCCFELWSRVMPERALACSFNLEYLLVGGRDARSSDRPIFMWYDWMVGGWGGRNGRDGANATAPVFGVGLATQPMEGQERLSPVITSQHAIRTDSGGPGRFRGGCGVEKGALLTDAERTVMSYCCDRARSITWGIEGGLPSIPHGVWLEPGEGGERFLGAVFSNVAIEAGTSFSRPSAGGGGYGDPLDRDPQRVLDDVLDGYVSTERAMADYGVVLTGGDAPALDEAATARERAAIRSARHGWLSEDAESVAARYRAGDLSVLDLCRRYGVIVDWGTGELLPESTRQFRAMLARRTVPHWT